MRLCINYYTKNGKYIKYRIIISTQKTAWPSIISKTIKICFLCMVLHVDMKVTGNIHIPH